MVIAFFVLLALIPLAYIAWIHLDESGLAARFLEDQRRKKALLDAVTEAELDALEGRE